MKLQSIAIRNFRVIRKADLTFPDQVIGITGPNGAGKSSLVEAIAWALYGARVARSGKEEIRSTYAAADENCSVFLEFEIGPEQYRLERSLVGRTERTEVTLFRNGRRESSGTAETEKHIAHLLGLDWRGFLTSFLARQQELNALANLTPVDRRAQLAGMLGIDRLDRAIKLVKDDRRAAEQAAEVLASQTAGRDTVQTRLNELREHVQHLENQQVAMEDASRAAARRLAETETVFREHEARQKACSQVRGKLDSARQALGHWERQRQDLISRRDRIDAARQELAGLEPQLERLPELHAQLDELKRRRDAAARAQQLTQQAAAWRAELDQTEKMEAVSRQELEGLDRQLSTLPPELPDRVRQAETRLEESRSRWTDLKAELATEEKTATLLREQLGSIRLVGPEAVCERCHRPFGDDLPEIQKHLAKELETAEAGCRNRKDELARIESQGRELKSELERVRGLDRSRTDLEVKRRSQSDRLADLLGRKERLAAQLEQLASQQKLLGPTEFDPRILESTSAEMARLETMRSRMLELRGEVRGWDEVVASVERTERELAATGEESNRLEAELESVGFDPAAFEAADRARGEAQAAAQEAKLALQNAAAELDFTRREIKSREDELGRLEEIGRRLEGLRTDQYYAEKLVNLFGDFRKYTISRIRPRLAELSSQLMAEMSGGRYSLVELDEDYNIQVMDGGEFFGIDRFSGGEKDLASLCLRLAISLALTESAGLDRSFIILDEVFGSQDTGRRDLIFEALANLKPRFPQMILITHLEELKHKVETVIELAPHPGGWSEVRVNGSVV